MALLNEILVGRYNRLVQKLLSMKGHASLVQLRGEMGVEIPLFHGAENRYLESWDIFQRAAQIVAPGAGNFGTFQLRNPPNSNVIAVVTAAVYSSALADTPGFIFFRPGTAGSTVDQPTLRVAVGIDGRGRAASTCIVSDNTGAAATATAGGTQAGFTNLPVNAAYNFVQFQEFPLSPGEMFQIVAGTANIVSTYTYGWRERFLEDSERA